MKNTGTARDIGIVANALKPRAMHRPRPAANLRTVHRSMFHGCSAGQVARGRSVPMAQRKIFRHASRTKDVLRFPTVPLGNLPHPNPPGALSPEPTSSPAQVFQLENGCFLQEVLPGMSC